jgi:hypothetical protein
MSAMLGGLLVGIPGVASASEARAATAIPGPEDACLDRTAAYIASNAQVGQVHYAACVEDTATVSLADGEGGADIVASEYSASSPEERNPLDGAGSPTSRAASDMLGSCTIRAVYEVGCQWKIKYTKWNGTTPVWTRSITVDSTLYLQVNSHELHVRFNHDQGIPFFSIGDATTMNMQGWAPPTVDSSVFINVYGSLGHASVQKWTDRVNLNAAKFSMYFTTDEIEDEAEHVVIPITGVVMTPRFQCPAVTVNNPDDYEQCEYPNGEEAPEF